MPPEDAECPTDLNSFIQLYWRDRNDILLPMHDDWKTWKRCFTLMQGGLIVLGVVFAVAKSQNIGVRSDLIQQAREAPPPIMPAGGGHK